MLRHQIIFPEANKAALVEETISDVPAPDRVLIQTAYTTISPGTERANISGDPNVYGMSAPAVRFPRSCGYSSSGIVKKVGSAVTRVQPGDRVVGYWSTHADYNLLPESRLSRLLTKRSACAKLPRCLLALSHWRQYERRVWKWARPAL